MWADKANRVYSERTDLTPETFALLVSLTLKRRAEVTRDNMVELWERDQEVLRAVEAAASP